MSRLIRWETPFTDVLFPAVDLIVLQKSAGTGIVVFVAPQGIDKYPKYKIGFANVVAFTCLEEAFSPEREYSRAKIEERNLCAYRWINSPWLEAYKMGVHFIAGGHSGDFFHYLIFGGDFIVEVITTGEPLIERVDEKLSFVIHYEI